MGTITSESFRGTEYDGHCDTVRDAMTPLERRMTLAVLILNLGLGLWFVRRADFSGVLPNQAPESLSVEDVAPPGPVAPDGPLVARNSDRP